MFGTLLFLGFVGLLAGVGIWWASQEEATSDLEVTDEDIHEGLVEDPARKTNTL